MRWLEIDHRSDPEVLTGESTENSAAGLVVAIIVNSSRT